MPGFGKRRGVPRDSLLKYHHTIGGHPSYFRFGSIATSGAWCSGAESGYQSQGTLGTQASLSQRAQSQEAQSQGTQSSDTQSQVTQASGTQESDLQSRGTQASGAQSGDSEYKSASSSLAEPTQRPAAERSSDTSSAMAPPPPLLFDRSPHEEEDDEEEMVFEVWVVSAAPHCSVATVIEYCGQFISIEVRVHHTS